MIYFSITNYSTEKIEKKPYFHLQATLFRRNSQSKFYIEIINFKLIRIYLLFNIQYSLEMEICFRLCYYIFFLFLFMRFTYFRQTTLFYLFFSKNVQKNV